MLFGIRTSPRRVRHQNHAAYRLVGARNIDRLRRLPDCTVSGEVKRLPEMIVLVRRTSIEHRLQVFNNSVSREQLAHGIAKLVRRPPRIRCAFGRPAAGTRSERAAVRLWNCTGPTNAVGRRVVRITAAGHGYILRVDDKPTPKVEVTVTFKHGWLSYVIVVLLFLCIILGFTIIENIASMASRGR